MTIAMGKTIESWWGNQGKPWIHQELGSGNRINEVAQASDDSHTIVTKSFEITSCHTYKKNEDLECVSRNAPSHYTNIFFL